MKRKRTKRNRRNSRNKPKSSMLKQLSIRDMWDLVVIVMLLTLVVSVAHYARNTNIVLGVWPQIKHVEVAGELHVSDVKDFKNIIKKRINGGFFNVQIEQLEKELSSLPWVYRAAVQRSWPDTLNVKIYQQDPIARWGKTGLMNAYGKVFFPSSVVAYTDLPMLYGEVPRATDLARVFEDSMQQLKPLDLDLQALFEDQRQSKNLVFSNGLILEIGDGDVSNKIRRFITAYEQYLSKHITEVKKVDLRYTNGLAVEWKDASYANEASLHNKVELVDQHRLDKKAQLANNNVGME